MKWSVSHHQLEAMGAEPILRFAVLHFAPPSNPEAPLLNDLEVVTERRLIRFVDDGKIKIRNNLDLRLNLNPIE